MDDMDNKLEELKGQAKEHLGGATGDEEMQAEGEKEQLTGNLKQAGDKIRDAFRS